MGRNASESDSASTVYDEGGQPANDGEACATGEAADRCTRWALRGAWERCVIDGMFRNLGDSCGRIRDPQALGKCISVALTVRESEGVIVVMKSGNADGAKDPHHVYVESAV